MDLFKLDKFDRMFVAFILVIITLFNIGQCFATENNDFENVDFSTVNGISIESQNNYFSNSANGSVGYFELEKGYIYYIKYVGSANVRIATSNSIPALNGTYNYLGTIASNETYSYISDGNSYLYFNFSWSSSNVSVTRVKIENMNGAIGDLVDNVGINQFWNVFEGGIDFVGVIVLVAFGLFLIVLLVKKISKGKADF